MVTHTHMHTHTHTHTTTTITLAAHEHQGLIRFKQHSRQFTFELTLARSISALQGARASHVAPLIPAWDFQSMRLDDTPNLVLNPCTKATSEMGKEKKRYDNRSKRGNGGREIEKERLHPDQWEC